MLYQVFQQNSGRYFYLFVGIKGASSEIIPAGLLPGYYEGLLFKYVAHVLNCIGLSRRSISLYESGNAATVDVFLKLEEILRTDFRKADHHQHN